MYGSDGPGGDSGFPGGGSGGPGGHWASSGTHSSGPYNTVADIEPVTGSVKEIGSNFRKNPDF